MNKGTKDYYRLQCALKDGEIQRLQFKLRQIQEQADAIFGCQGYTEGLKEQDGAPVWIGPRLHQIRDLTESN